MPHAEYEGKKNMTQTRTVNTTRNIIWTYIDYFSTFVFSYITRAFIIQYLGKDYLGISSLYTSILQVLNVVELGFSSAIVYNLYKPIAENNIKEVNSIMFFYKKAYTIIGLFIFVGGLVLCPFLRKIIKNDFELDINIYILFLLYLINTSASYVLFAYKATLLNALQRLDLTKKVYSIVNLFQYLGQICAIVFLKNIYLFVIILIVGTIIKNFGTSFLVEKYYPYLKEKLPLSKETKNDIIIRLKGLVICKVSGVSYNSFGNIILSSFLGLGTVAMYSNYLLIYNSIVNIVFMIRHAMQASIGNKLADDSKENNLENVYLWQFTFSCIACFTSICLMCLCQNFIVVWVGNDMLLSQRDVVLLSILLYITIIQHSFCLYLTGAGLWWNLRYVYISSTVINLLLNIVLCKLMQTTGIIIANIVIQLFFGYFLQTKILFDDYFKARTWKFHMKTLKYISAYVALCVLFYFLCGLIKSNTLVSLVYKSVLCVIVIPLLMIALYHQNSYYKKMYQYFINGFNAIIKIK